MVRLFRPLLRQAGRDVRIVLCEGHRARGVRIAAPVTSVAGSQGQFFGSAVRTGGGTHVCRPAEKFAKHA